MDKTSWLYSTWSFSAICSSLSRLPSSSLHSYHILSLTMIGSKNRVTDPDPYWERSRYFGQIGSDQDLVIPNGHIRFLLLKVGARSGSLSRYPDLVFFLFLIDVKSD